MLLVLFVLPGRSRGQAAAETAGADSSSAGAVSALSKKLPTSLPHPEVESNSTSIPARQGLPQDEANRRILEQQAGKDAARVLLQSIPSEAVIYIDGIFVGRTPLLLIVPPGKYKVEMRGPRQEFGERLIDLSPNETQQVAVTLALRYPSSISALPGSPAPRAGAEGNTASLAVREGPAVDEINRKALEQRAGADAANLTLQSVPSGARTYLDGVFVGRTPLLLVVPPGKYKVEMRGQHGVFGGRLVGLLPNETQQLAITLESRYPARVSAR
jgi:hypothetical protein